MTAQVVEITRLYGDHYHVAAWDIFGNLIAERTYRHSKYRKRYAINQAKEWAERHYLHFDEKTIIDNTKAK